MKRTYEIEIDSVEPAGRRAHVHRVTFTPALLGGATRHTTALARCGLDDVAVVIRSDLRGEVQGLNDQIGHLETLAR